MPFPDQVALRPQPYADSPAALPQRSAAPQSWMVRVAAAEYHWYDLIAGVAGQPAPRDPIGRHLRDMQRALEATARQRQLFFAVTRPRLRFDLTGVVQWGFFSLKLTLPLLVGAAAAKESVTVELKAPIAATMQKPTVVLSEHFISLNWGSLVEVFSVHELLHTHASTLKLPSQVAYVGQTGDADGRPGQRRLPALQQLRAQAGMEQDMLILALDMAVTVHCADGDPAALPHNAQAAAAEMLAAERIDVIEAALIRHFEGAAPRWRPLDERQARAARLTAVQTANNLVQYTIDLALPPDAAGGYGELGSAAAGAAARHLLSCYIVDGQAQVAPMPLPSPRKGGSA